MLLREGSPALVARVRRDLIDDDEAPGSEEIAGYAEVKAALRKQDKDGSFAPKPPDKALGAERFARCIATIRGLDHLLDLGLRDHPALGAAAEVILSSQGSDGGIADLAIGETKDAPGKLPALHLQGWALAVLCRAGLDADKRVAEGFRFLLEWKQADGGWAWRGVRADSAARPSSHLVTGMVLRAFAASPTRRTSREPRRAAELLATRFLQPDRYPDRKAATFWEQLTEPRCYTDVLDALDSVTAIGLGKENSGVRTAEAYLRGRQNSDGLWYPGGPARPDEKAKAPTPKEREVARWLTLRTVLVLRRVN